MLNMTFAGIPLALLLTALSLAPAIVTSAADFYSYYTHIDSTEPFERFSRTDDFADVVVKIGGASGQLVFWRGTSYLPVWQTAAGKWPLEEIIARKGDGTAEMPDRQGPGGPAFS